MVNRKTGSSEGRKRKKSGTRKKGRLVTDLLRSAQHAEREREKANFL